MRSAVVLWLLGAAVVWAAPPRDAVPATGSPDLRFFGRGIVQDLHTHCAGCHSDPEVGGSYILDPLHDLDSPQAARVLINFRSTTKFVHPKRPAASPLLRKALGLDSHGGGPIFGSVRHRAYQRLLDFSLGATLKNRPPDAITKPRARGRVGARLVLDGSLSGDRDKDDLTFHWRLVERPDRSEAELKETEDDDAIGLVPDRVGIYRIELTVHDGRLRSEPATTVVAVAKAKPDTTGSMRPGSAGTGDAKSEPKASVLAGRLDPDRTRLLRRTFLDLLQRSPRLGEYETWLRKSHAETVAALLKTEEVWDAWYEQQLYFLLLLDRFRPKEGPLTRLPGQLARGEITVPRALESIVRSQFFNARNPGNDTFVTVVLEQCLGMVVQKNTRILEKGKRMYDGYRERLYGKKGNSQADFVRIVFRQRTFFEHLIRRSYRALMGKEPDRKVLRSETDVLMLNPAGFPRLLQKWLTSEDYVQSARLARPKPEVPFVRTLFLDLLGRPPTYDELRNVRNAFLSLADPTPLRLVVGKILMKSPEFRAPTADAPERFVREQFLRLLGRPPSAKESETFVRKLREDAAVTPTLVIWAILSSPEYQTY